MGRYLQPPADTFPVSKHTEMRLRPSPDPRCHVRSSGVTRVDRPGWHHRGGWHPTESLIFSAGFTRTLDKPSGGKRRGYEWGRCTTTTKTGYHFWRRWLKTVATFCGKIWWDHQLLQRVTPTLVTPLLRRSSSISTTVSTVCCSDSVSLSK